MGNAVTLDTEYERETRERTSSGGASTEKSRILFKENFSFDFEGAVYHPKLVEFDLDFEVAPQQQREKSTMLGNSDFEESYLTHYSFNSRILKSKPYNFMFFFDKQRVVQNEAFFERQVIDSKNFGITANYRNQLFPVTLGYTDSKQDIDRSIRAGQHHEDEEMTFYTQNDSKLFGETQVDYTYEKFLRTEEGLVDQEGDGNQVMVSNMRSWGEEEERLRLDSRLNYRDMKGTRDNSNLTLSETFHFKHSDDLRTNYRYNLSNQKVAANQTDQQSLQFQLQHSLYESLETSFNVRGSGTDADNYESKGLDVSLKEDYKKKIGPSLLRLGFGYTRDQEDRDSNAVSFNVANESHVLDDAVVVTLDEASIVASSIVVSNTAGTTLYTLNTDYQIVSLVSGQTEIRRVVTGSILDGQEVLVDYASSRSPSLKYTGALLDYHFGLGFWDERFRVYYNLRQRRYPKIDGEASNILEEYDDMILGAQWQWDRGRVGAEYQDYVTSLTPYHSLRLFQDITLDVFSKGQIMFYTSQSFVDQQEEERKHYEMRVDYLWRFSPSAVFQFKNAFRLQSGSGEDTKNFTSRLAYRLNLGVSSFETGYEYEKEESVGTDVSNHYIFSTLKREF